MDYIDIAGPAGGTINMGGTKQRLLWAPKSDLATVAELPASPTTFADYARIVDSHVFITDRGFSQLYCTMDRGEANAESVGDHDGKAVRTTGKIFIPGDDPITLGMIAHMSRDYGIYLIELLTGNMGSRYMQIGYKDMWGFLAPGWTSAKNSEGVKGSEIEIMSYQPNPIIYEGDIELLP